MIDHTKPPCGECGSYDDERHGLECSKSNLTPEEKVAQWKAAYATQYRVHQETSARNSRAFKLLQDKVTFWQGKCAILKQENNALRRKVSRQK